MIGLQARQRAAVPINRSAPRRGEAAGGYDTATGRTIARGIETEESRYPGTVFDREITRDRGPYYDHDRYMPPAQSWVDWTSAGPVRPELHMRNYTLRDLVGNSRSRYPVVNTASTGMHTMTPAGVARTVPRYVETPQMTPARQDRLAAGQYAGQTYSQTTRPQGRRR